MTALDYGKYRCSYGTWHGLDEKCTCADAQLSAPGALPTDLPWVERPGTTVRYSVDEQFRVQLKAALTHPAETVVRRPIFAKEYQL